MRIICGEIDFLKFFIKFCRDGTRNLRMGVFHTKMLHNEKKMKTGQCCHLHMKKCLINVSKWADIESSIIGVLYEIWILWIEFCLWVKKLWNCFFYSLHSIATCITLVVSQYAQNCRLKMVWCMCECWFDYVSVLLFLSYPLNTPLTICLKRIFIMLNVMPL